MASPIEQLTEIFRHFPGIGPKQARRFVYYLLGRPDYDLKKLAGLLNLLHNEVSECRDCHRFFPKNATAGAICSLCADQDIDHSSLLVVEKDVDLDNIKKSGAYTGRYFVLGGLIPILEKNPEEKVRLKLLRERIETDYRAGNLKEVILALSANPDGDNTADYLQATLHHLMDTGLKVSLLGRGLSTGTELEYSDADTIKNALKNRA
jgi:recombination protein RecR